MTASATAEAGVELPVGPAILFCPADRPDRYGEALERADTVIIDPVPAGVELGYSGRRDWIGMTIVCLKETPMQAMVSTATIRRGSLPEVCPVSAASNGSSSHAFTLCATGRRGVDGGMSHSG